VSYFVRASTSNTSTVTFTPNSGVLAAKSVKKLNNLPLLSGDVAGAGHWLELVYDDISDQYVLMNPSTGAVQVLGVPVGSTIYVCKNTPPTGYLKANGAAVLRSAYPELFAELYKSSTATISIASPGVVGWTGHTLSANDPVQWLSTGTLPTGFVTATNYYVVGASITANTFQLSATPGGAAINTSGSQSGTHTAINAPFGIGDGSTTFNVPDLRGEFIRGWDNARGIDSNRAFGILELDQLQDHAHYQGFAPYSAPNGNTSPKDGGASNPPTAETQGVTTAARVGTETRPRNLALLACIKY
jgi:hypothetical protein